MSAVLLTKSDRRHFYAQRDTEWLRDEIADWREAVLLAPQHKSAIKWYTRIAMMRAELKLRGVKIDG